MTAILDDVQHDDDRYVDNDDDARGVLIMLSDRDALPRNCRLHTKGCVQHMFIKPLVR